MSKNITTEIYREELQQIAPNIIVRGEYITAKTPIEHECLVCGHVWNAIPNNIKRGKGCPECGKKKRAEKRTLTLKDFTYRYKDTINKNVQIIGDYVGCNKHILCKCLICGEEYSAPASVVAKGGIHSKCAAKIVGDKLRMGHDDFEKRIETISPTIKILGCYKSTEDKIDCECLICGHLWASRAGNLLNGRGCPKCSYKERGIKNRTSQEQYVQKLKELNPTVLLMGDYINAHTKTLHKCTIHNIEWEITPANALNGQGCKLCSKERIGQALTKSNEDYITEITKLNPNVVPVEEYRGANIKILHHYKKCGHEYYVSPSAVIQGGDCNICAKFHACDKFKKDNDTYVNELKDVNPFVVPLEEYKGSSAKIKHRCTIDGYEWEVVPSSLLAGHGCPVCCMSMGERKIRTWLEKHNIRYTTQKFYLGLTGVNGGLLTYDFYLPDYRTVIEFQGEQHEHSIGGYFGGDARFEVQVEHDRRKKEYAKKHNLNLLEIWYYDMYNIDQILENYLNSKSVETTGDKQ